jgi:hypothetical protein
MIRLRQLKKWDAVYWASPPDQGALTMPQKMAAKADGYEAGVFDLTIIGARNDLTKVWLVEFKYGKNTYTKEQKDVVEAFNNTLVDTIQVKSIDEFQEFVENNLK